MCDAPNSSLKTCDAQCRSQTPCRRHHPKRVNCYVRPSTQHSAPPQPVRVCHDRRGNALTAATNPPKNPSETGITAESTAAAVAPTMRTWLRVTTWRIHTRSHLHDKSVHIFMLIIGASYCAPSIAAVAVEVSTGQQRPRRSQTAQVAMLIAVRFGMRVHSRCNIVIGRPTVWALASKPDRLKRNLRCGNKSFRYHLFTRLYSIKHGGGGCGARPPDMITCCCADGSRKSDANKSHTRARSRWNRNRTPPIGCWTISITLDDGSVIVVCVNIVHWA